MLTSAPGSIRQHHMLLFRLGICQDIDSLPIPPHLRRSEHPSLGPDLPRHRDCLLPRNRHLHRLHLPTRAKILAPTHGRSLRQSQSALVRKVLFLTLIMPSRFQP
jgi:hypothetical protein